MHLKCCSSLYYGIKNLPLYRNYVVAMLYRPLMSGVSFLNIVSNFPSANAMSLRPVERILHHQPMIQINKIKQLIRPTKNCESVLPFAFTLPPGGLIA